jgi:hypothetical protein
VEWNDSFMSFDVQVRYGKGLLARGLVREAADFAIRFKMQQHFTLDELVLPLIKRKLVDSVIRYVEVQPFFSLMSSSPSSWCSL